MDGFGHFLAFGLFGVVDFFPFIGIFVDAGHEFGEFIDQRKSIDLAPAFG